MRKTAALVCLLLPAAAHAQVALNTLNSGMSFGKIDFSGATGVGDVTLGSNGMVNYGSNTSGDGFGTSAQVEIAAAEGTVVDISCDISGQLANGIHTLNVNPVRFIVGSTHTGIYANDTSCVDINTTATTHTVGATTAENTIYVGGKLVLDGQSLTNGTFNTSGGTPVNFRVLVQ